MQSKEKPIEYLRIYDEQNQPTEKLVPRDVAHAEGLWHRTVHIYIIRTAAAGIEVLIHTRSLKKKQYAGMLDPVFGGHVQSDQDEHSTAVAELEEEIGIHAASERLVYRGFAKKDDPVHAPNDREFNMIFVYELSKDEEERLSLNTEEIEQVQWVPLRDIQQQVENSTGVWRPSGDELARGIAVAFSSPQ